MATIAEPNVVIDGLVFNLDAANSRCYSGSGITVNGLVGGIGGTLVNGVGFTSTNQGSFVFDGVDDYIELGTSIQNYSVFTTSIWINFNFFNTSHRSPLGDNTQLYSYHLLFLNGDLYVAFSTNPTWAYAAVNHGPISINTWYNFVVTKNSSNTIVFYKNGNLLGSSSAVGAANLNKIGTGYVYDNAKISNVSFYNRALSAQEILQNYNATKSRYGY
jgi:hypothetical protein